MPKNCGLSFTITQAFGEMDTSQSVNAYRASMVISGEVPGARLTSISISAAVLSTTFLILILPLSFAFTMESMRDEVVVPKGISLMIRVDLSRSSMAALTRTLPPRFPSL